MWCRPERGPSAGLLCSETPEGLSKTLLKPFFFVGALPRGNALLVVALPLDNAQMRLAESKSR
jgi:hypothetical protein